MSDSFARADDGLRLFVRVVGDTGPIVIVPGAAWLEGHLNPLHHAGRRIVFYDTQARGRSEAGSRQRLTFDYEVSDLEAVRRHVGGERVSLIGWSYLGAVVALYASKHPARVESLAMLCPMAARPGPFEGMAPYLDRNLAREAEMEERLDELRRLAEGDPSPESWRAFQLLRATIRMDDPAAAERVIANPWQYEQEWAPNVEPTLEALFESLDDFDWRPAMAVVDAPALVVHGESDGPAEVRQEWADAFANGCMLRLPNTGHYPFIEAPGQLFPALEQHLDGST